MNKQVKPVVIGTIGAGYAAHLHGNGYEKVSGVPIRLKTVCDLNLDLANQVKERYGYEQAITNFDDMLADRRSMSSTSSPLLSSTAPWPSRP